MLLLIFKLQSRFGSGTSPKSTSTWNLVQEHFKLIVFEAVFLPGRPSSPWRR